MKIESKKGFTLIELLIVVAIMAVLSSVVLSSLGSARTRASDNAIKADLVSVANQAEIYYGLNNSYVTFAEATCPISTGGGSGMFNTDEKIVSIIKHAVTTGGNGSACSSTSETYAIAIGLKTSGQSLCIDNTKIVRQFTGTPAAAITNSACNP